MKRIWTKDMLIVFALFLVSVISSDTKASCDILLDGFSEDTFLIWFDDKYDNSAEIGEMRNEYLFCCLEDTDRCCRIMQFILRQDTNIIKKIEKELQYPIHDGFDLKVVKDNVSKSNIDKEVKEKWMQIIPDI